MIVTVDKLIKKKQNMFSWVKIKHWRQKEQKKSEMKKVPFVLLRISHSFDKL